MSDRVMLPQEIFQQKLALLEQEQKRLESLYVVVEQISEKAMQQYGDSEVLLTRMSKRLNRMAARTEEAEKAIQNFEKFEEKLEQSWERKQVAWNKTAGALQRNVERIALGAQEKIDDLFDEHKRVTTTVLEDLLRRVDDRFEILSSSIEEKVTDLATFRAAGEKMLLDVKEQFQAEISNCDSAMKRANEVNEALQLALKSFVDRLNDVVAEQRISADRIARISDQLLALSESHSEDSRYLDSLLGQLRSDLNDLAMDSKQLSADLIRESAENNGKMTLFEGRLSCAEKSAQATLLKRFNIIAPYALIGLLMLLQLLSFHRTSSTEVRIDKMKLGEPISLDRTMRIWTDSAGSTVRAVFVELNTNFVTLQKQDGKVYKVALDRLSKVDQGLVKEWENLNSASRLKSKDPF